MKEFAESEWQRAEKSLEAARKLIDVDPDSSASRAYYAAFHGATALFALRETEFSKHTALRAAVHRDLVKAGIWDIKLGADFDFLMDLRVSWRLWWLNARNAGRCSTGYNRCGTNTESNRGYMRFSCFFLAKITITKSPVIQVETQTKRKSRIKAYEEVTSLPSELRDLCELPHATDSNTVAKTYTWGLDLSGDLQGAGGVGGLLCVTKHEEQGTKNPYYPSYDANGNVSEYIDDTDSVVAHYEYSPFGKLTSSSGSKAGDFNHRFSTKYHDSETALYSYGYRYYSSELGRWLSRDPMGEQGGVNLYVFLSNHSIKDNDVQSF